MDTLETAVHWKECRVLYKVNTSTKNSKHTHNHIIIPFWRSSTGDFDYLPPTDFLLGIWQRTKGSATAEKPHDINVSRNLVNLLQNCTKNHSCKRLQQVSIPEGQWNTAIPLAPYYLLLFRNNNACILHNVPFLRYHIPQCMKWTVTTSFNNTIEIACHVHFLIHT